MAEYVDIGQLWACKTCYHQGSYGCALGFFGCDHGENYRPDSRKLQRANVVPVVTGEWLKPDFNASWQTMEATCSHCGVRGEIRFRKDDSGVAFPDSDFCPKCGAKMMEVH